MEEFISKWQNAIVGILVVLILIYGTYNYIYKPKIREIKSLQNSLKLINSEIMMIQGGDLLLKDLDAARAMLKKELSEISVKIPQESETPYLINNFISVVGKGLNIDYNLIQPGDLAPEQRYKRLPLRVEFEGDYADLNSYLAQLKKLPVTIRVDTMDLHKLTGKKLAVRMLLSAFVLPGAKQKPPGTLSEYYTVFDPFYSASTARVKREGLKLEATTGLKYSGYWMGKNIKAIINDEVLTAGQSISGFEVLRIFKDRIILKKNSKLYELTLGGK